MKLGIVNNYRTVADVPASPVEEIALQFYLSTGKHLF